MALGVGAPVAVGIEAVAVVQGAAGVAAVASGVAVLMGTGDAGAVSKVGGRVGGTWGLAPARVGHTFSKHGSGNTDQLLKQAQGSGRAVGQWVDDAAAEQFVAKRLPELKNGAKLFDLPEGLGRMVNPDGTFSPATRARLVPSGSGVKTAYPEP